MAFISFIKIIQMEHRSKCKTQAMQFLEGNIGENIVGLRFGNEFQIQHQNYSPRKKKLVNQTPLKLKTLLWEIYYKENGKISHQLEENLQSVTKHIWITDCHPKYTKNF